MHVQFEIPGLKDIQEMAKKFLTPVQGFIAEATKSDEQNSAMKVVRVATAFFALAGSGLFLGCAVAFKSASAALAATGLFMFAIAILPCEHRASTIARLAQDLFSFCFRFIPEEGHRVQEVRVESHGPEMRAAGTQRVAVGDHGIAHPSFHLRGRPPFDLD